MYQNLCPISLSIFSRGSNATVSTITLTSINFTYSIYRNNDKMQRILYEFSFFLIKIWSNTILEKVFLKVLSGSNYKKNLYRYFY